MNQARDVRSRKTLLVAVFCVMAILAQFGAAAYQPHWSQMSTTGATREYGRLVGMMAQIVRPLRDAHYAASQACEGVTPDAIRIHAQAVINLLEGENSSLFDASLQMNLELGEGIRAVVDSHTFTEDWYDPEKISSGTKESLEAMLSRLQSDLALASQYAQEVIAEDGGLAWMQMNIAVVCARLSNTLMLVEGDLGSWGYEIWLSPGDSIHEALDDVREGATIYLAPAVYTESLTIAKNVTLVGTFVESRPSFDIEGGGYETVLQPEDSQPAISVFAHRSIEVTIRQLTIQSASQAIQIGGKAQATLDEVDIVESAIGVSVRNTASLTMTDCVLDDNEISVQLNGSATASIADCEIEGGGIAMELSGSANASLADLIIGETTSLDGAIQLHGESSLEMFTSWIIASAGNGILVQDGAGMSLVDSYVLSSSSHGVVVRDQAELNLTRSRVYKSAGDGIRLSGACSLVMNESSVFTSQGFGIRALTEECAPEGTAANDLFTGTVSIGQSAVPIPNLDEPNLLGPVCPADLESLMQTSP